MSLASNLYGGSLIPVGDNHRLGSSINLGTSDTTVLNLTSTSGVLQGLIFFGNSTENRCDSLKITVDNASERTYSFDFARIGANTCSSFYLPLLIPFNNALTVKVRKQSNTSSIFVTPSYSEK